MSSLGETLVSVFVQTFCDYSIYIIHLMSVPCLSNLSVPLQWKFKLVIPSIASLSEKDSLCFELIRMLIRSWSLTEILIEGLFQGGTVRPDCVVKGQSPWKLSLFLVSKLTHLIFCDWLGHKFFAFEDWV